MSIEQTLHRAEVFLGLDDSDLGKIAALPSCREEAYQPGEVIFEAGNEAKYLHVLKEGQVDLVTEVPARADQPAIQVVVDRITTRADQPKKSPVVIRSTTTGYPGCC
jgi:signal-transduction protein with cAMP-binding, CBS, and nucleotidyltransferase domain